MRHCPLLFVGRQASLRLRGLRELARNLYFSCGALAGLKEFVLAVSVRENTVWIWIVVPALDQALRDTLVEDANRYGVTFVDLSIVVPEEAEGFRERCVKGTESYQIFWKDDIDGLFDQFEERLLEGAQ